MSFIFDSIESAINDIRLGKMVIVVDDEDRENEGDLVMAAEKVTPDAINFMASKGKGLICTPLTPEIASKLNLPILAQDKSDGLVTAFTMSIDATNGITTGISSYDRAVTVKLLTEPDTKPEDFVRPGHIFPLIARPGGVLRRAGHTEAAVDLATLADLAPCGVICEIMKDDGSMARVTDLFEYGKEHDLKIITIEDLIKYRREQLVCKTEVIDFKCDYGDFDLHMYESLVDQSVKEHVALVKGDISGVEPVLVRVHSECFTGDIFSSKRCDCGDQLSAALKQIEREGRGVLLYMRQEGRGIGLKNKIKAYKLQDKGLDTVEANQKLGFKADLRDYGVGAHILKDLGIKRMRLLTNNPKKIVGLEGHNLEVVERVPIEIEANQENMQYLMTKRDKMGHLIMNSEVH